MNYKVEKVAVYYQNREFFLVKPEDPCELIDLDTHDDDTPYWAEEWPSSEIALQILPEIIENRNDLILEIGAGAGTVTTRLNALFPNYIAGDFIPEACYTMEQNRKLNNGTFHPIAMDWNHSPFSEKFNTIVAIDVLYEEQMTEPVLQFLADHLTENGKAFVFDPQRFFWKKFKETTTSFNLNITNSIIQKSSTGIAVEMVTIERDA